MRRDALFRADWLDAVFLNCRVDQRALQAHVPLELDLFEGDAYVSLVAFTQARLRLDGAGRWGRWLTAPLARHAFLNLRTYVRCGDVRGIYFLAEWIPNRLAAVIGPRVYGLPYRVGRVKYWTPDAAQVADRNAAHARQLNGDVRAGGGAFSFVGCLSSREFGVAPTESLDAFLLERYSAFTCCRGVLRRFDVAHDPWPQTRLDARIINDSLPASVGAWWKTAQLVSANYSPGVYDVAISAPLTLAPADTLPPPAPSRSLPAQRHSRGVQGRRIP